MANIKELRFLVDMGNDIRKIAKIAFSNSDSSIYIFPYAPNGRYYYGGRHVEEIVFKDKVRFTDDIFSDRTPKLSIHESGQVHIKAKSNLAGPMFIPPLMEWRGQHIASVSIDNFSSLSKFRGSISSEGSRIDHVIPSGEVVNSGRLVFYIAGDRAAFEEPNCRIVLTMIRPSLENPVYIGIQPKAQDSLSDIDLGGITVISGWKVPSDPSEGMNFLYIRGT